MSVKIRLSKVGKTNSPSFRVVVSTTRTKQKGKFLDIIGHYNPSEQGTFEYDKDKYKKWVSKGALPTQAINDLVAGDYTYKEYSPGEVKEETSQVEPKVEEKSQAEPQNEEVPSEVESE